MEKTDSFKTINGDCLIELPELIKGGVKANFIFTSPPYNRLRNDKYENYQDTLNEEDYLKLLYDSTNYSLELVGDDGFVFLNNRATYYNAPQIYEYIGHYSKQMSHIIIQVFNNPQPNDNYKKESNDYSVTTAYEYFFVLNKNRNALRCNFGYTKNVVFSNVTTNPYSKIHHATMNPKISDWFIKTFTKKGDLIIDPFMGLGTTGISALKMGRKFIGIELDKEYYTLATKRLTETDKNINNNLSVFFEPL